MTTLFHEFELKSPPAAVFTYYTDLKNLVRLTPPELNLRILEATSPLRIGSRIVFGVRPRMVPFETKWLVEISEFEPDRLFTDKLLNGPFDYWVHRHTFAETPTGGTRLRDTIEYDSPNGLIGRILGAGMIDRMLRDTFRHREKVIRRDLP